jgi:transcriptional regulator GlxA family with amidase domain
MSNSETFVQTSASRSKKLRVGILLFNNVEVLDYCGPFEVFSATRLSNEDSNTAESPFDVMLVAESTSVITTTGGMKVMPDVSYEDCPPLDILLVPGGLGTRDQMNHEHTLSFIQKEVTTVRVLSSVCTGSLILGQAGLLRGHRATTHWMTLDLLGKFESVTVDRSRHWVREEYQDDKLLFTSAGISAGIDMALKIVEEIYGEECSRMTAKYMEYPYPESNHRRVKL